MEGRTQASRSINEPSHLPSNGLTADGGGTYTGTSNQPLQADWEGIFGPAGRDVKQDNQRHKRHQRWHLPDVLKGPNQYLTDRVDGLISDTTNSPFTTVILPYKFLENPDAKFKWNVWSFDEGLASRVPYESAARVLTQTKRSYAAFAVRHGLAIRLEHNFMMSPKGMENFQNQVKQLVGSIQQSNDLDVHIALIQAPSYAKEYMEKYSTVDKTPNQLIREYVELFGMMQKNPNCLDILIEEAKIQLRLWGSPEPTFLMCNSKLTFQMQMTPERTNYMTQGMDGVRRLRQGPDLGQYRGLNIIHSRAYSLETGALPRDILRRRVRVAEYYRVPPQKNDKWEVELYDESRDSWFKLTAADLDRYADLSGHSSGGDSHAPGVDETNKLTWAAFTGHQGQLLNLNRFRLKMADEPEGTVTSVTMPSLLHGSANIEWANTYRQLETMQTGAYQNMHTKEDYFLIYQHLAQDNRFIPVPNHTNMVDVDCPHESRYVPFWLFMNAAFLDGVANFLWTTIKIDRDIVRQKIIPFVFGADHATVLRDYDAIPDDARVNIYHTIMFLGTSLRWHPDDDVRARLEKLFSEKRAGVHTIRAALVQFVRRVTDDTGMEEMPRNRIQLGRRLDDVFKGNRFPRADEKNCMFHRWPESTPGLPSVANAARVSETHGTLEDYRIEELYNRDPGNYTWNTLPPIRGAGQDGTIHEPTVIDSFFYAALLRMMSWPVEDKRFPEFWPVLSTKGSSEAVEYVIVRPVIEHNMLSVIMGRGGDDLGNTLWGQTELSCYDDAMHGVWGMSYKYHQRAIVHNNKNLIRTYDIAFDGYNGGKDDRPVDWAAEAPGGNRPFNARVGDMSVPYNGPSLMVFKFNVDVNSKDYARNWPSPIQFHDKLDIDPPRHSVDPEALYAVSDPEWRVFNRPIYREQYRGYLQRMPDFSYFHQTRKLPGYASVEAETTQNALAFQGSMRIINGLAREEIHGSGHHGPDYNGVAMLRSGKGTRPIMGAPTPMRLC
jgi:hypothetical protein